MLVAGIVYAGLNIYLEVRDAGVITETWLPFILLGIALLIALGFEFVNGFHDTANAVATVIYTHSLAPNVAVLWSGLWNFIGVMVSSGAVAFVIISLQPRRCRARWQDRCSSQRIWHAAQNSDPAAVYNVRNDMYLVSKAMRVMFNTGVPSLDQATKESLTPYKGELDYATKYIPLWVKVSVAIALGLGTMIGWKRIVVTVGEKIGKSHLTYAQGASAELVAISTTQVLSSGVAGTMAANGSGLQMATVRNLLMAWVLTLPMAVFLSGSLYWILSYT
jgi:phosphate/sulfate permease